MSVPPSAGSDRNLLFGILALQLDFIARDQLIAAMSAWATDKNKALGQILVEQKALTPDRRTLLEGLVQEHLKQHGDDPHQSLAVVAPLGPVRDELKQIADGDVHASLAYLSTAPKEDDPYATQSQSLGTPTSSGLRFRILRPHARGGLGKVSIAHDEELDREVALKEIQERHALNPEAQARFLLEARVTGGLEHPGIVPVYGLGQYEDGRPFYAMRFIRGDNLKDAIQRFHKAGMHGRSPGERALELRKLLGRFLDVCNAIAYAHSRGVLHRDLKPGNVMLGQFGETLVVDWGLAKPGQLAEPVTATGERPLRPPPESGSAATQMGRAMGTPAYMSPEQAAGHLDLVGAASDVYSLGATLYHLLTGVAPFEEDAAGGTLDRVQRGDFVPPRQLKSEVSAALEAVCLKAMARRPEDRYGSVKALAEDVEQWLAGEPVSAWPEPWAVRARRWLGRHRTAMTGAAAAALVAVVSLGVATALLTAANEEERKARELAQRKEQDAVAARTDLQRANAALSQSRDSLQKVNDQLETTLARSLLRPLALHRADGDRSMPPLTAPEIEAVWELAEARSPGLGLRFVAEASRGPVTSRQLRGRAAYALHAAVGLDPDKRARAERLLRERLAGLGPEDAQRTDLALAVAALGDPTPETAAAVARTLTRALGRTSAADPAALAAALAELASGVTAVGRRLDATDAAAAGDALVAAMGKTDDAAALRALVEALEVVGARLSGERAARQAGAAADAVVAAMRKTDGLSSLGGLAEGLKALSGRLDAARAARVADALVATMCRTDSADAIHGLAEGLKAVSPRLATTATASAAEALVATMRKTKAPGKLVGLAEGLKAVGASLTADRAEAAAEALVTAMVRTADNDALAGLALGVKAVGGRLGAERAGKLADVLVATLVEVNDPDRLHSLTVGLEAVSARLDMDWAAKSLERLGKAMGTQKNPFVVLGLLEGVQVVGARLEPVVAAVVVETMLADVRKAKDSEATIALAVGLKIVGGRLNPGHAAEVGDVLIAGLRNTKESLALFFIVESVKLVGGRLDPDRVRKTAEALVAAMGQAEDPDVLAGLAEALKAVGGGLNADRAARAAAILVAALGRAKTRDSQRGLVEGLKVVGGRLDTERAAGAGDGLVAAMRKGGAPEALRQAALALAAVSVRLDANRATRQAGEAADLLVAALRRTNDPDALGALGLGLKALGGRLTADRANAAADALVAALRRTTNWAALADLAESLEAVGGRLEAARAGKVADALVAPAQGATDAGSLNGLAEGLKALAERLDAGRASRAADTLIGALGKTGDAYQRKGLRSSLGAVLTRQHPRQLAHRMRDVTGAVGAAGGPGCLLAVPAWLQAAAAPVPSPLPAQALVDLLKHPLGVGPARRAVLDQLGRHYDRAFADAWDFVRFARAQGRPPDLTSPPQRQLPRSAEAP